MESIIGNICKNVRTETLMSIEDYNDDEERIKFILYLLKLCDIEVPKIRVLGKSSEYSKIYREEAADLIVQNCTAQQLQKVCDLCSKSIAYAPVDSPELAFAYAERSAALFRLRKYAECIGDIDSCLALNYPDNMKVRILIRKVECFILTKSPRTWKIYNQTREWIDRNLKGNEKEKSKKRLEMSYKKWEKNGGKNVEAENSLADFDVYFKDFTYTETNKEVPCSSDALELHYSWHDYGRHVVAARDIKPGEILVNEKPYCSVLNVNRRYAQCWGCLQETWNGIPCEHCPNVIYCSEKCRSESWQRFHDVECHVLPSLLDFETKGTEMVGIASLRMLIMALKEYGNISSLKKEVQIVDDCKDMRTKGFSEDGKFYSDKYRSVCSLMTNTECQNWTDLIYRSSYVMIILYYLATKTTSLEKKFPEDWNAFDNEEAIFIGGLLLRNYQILASNALTEKESYDAKVREEGAVLLPFISCLNHSCTPNVSRSSQSDHQVLFAIKPIEKGEQIFCCYGLSYTHSSQFLREELLYEHYFFICECNACIEDWPLKEDLPSYDFFMCHDHRFPLQKIMIQFAPYIKNMKHISKIMEEFPRALFTLSDALTFLWNTLPYPCREENIMTDLLKAIFDANRSLQTYKNPT